METRQITFEDGQHPYNFKCEEDQARILDALDTIKYRSADDYVTWKAYGLRLFQAHQNRIARKKDEQLSFPGI